MVATTAGALTNMSTRGPGNGNDELSTALYEARRNAGLSQPAVADQTDLSQNKISRVEHNKGLLSSDEARQLLDVYGIRGSERRRIMDLVEASHQRYHAARVILQRGAHHFQARLRALAEDSHKIRSFVPTAVAGYLQSPSYMRVVFTQRQSEEKAQPSIKDRGKQQLLLDNPSREWHVIQTEGAVRWCIGDPQVMADQIGLIIEAIDRPNVKLGFIPWHRPADLLPLTGFHIYDQSAVVVGTWSGTAIIRDDEEVRDYELLFERIAGLAVYGDTARSELRRIAGEYQQLDEEGR